MTKLITILIIAIVIFGGWQLVRYYDKVKSESENGRIQEAPQNISPSSLPGLPYTLEPTLEEARKQGAKGLRDWLKRYGKQVQDPRLAWIQLDYVVLVARDSPAEAKQVFAEVRERVTPDSPVYPRVKQLEKTYSQ